MIHLYYISLVIRQKQMNCFLICYIIPEWYLTARREKLTLREINIMFISYDYMIRCYVDLNVCSEHGIGRGCAACWYMKTCLNSISYFLKW